MKKLMLLLGILLSLNAFANLSCIPAGEKCGFFQGDSGAGSESYNVCKTCCSKEAEESGDHWFGYNYTCTQKVERNCIESGYACKFIPGDAGGKAFDRCNTCCSGKSKMVNDCHYAGQSWACQ